MMNLPHTTTSRPAVFASLKLAMVVAVGLGAVLLMVPAYRLQAQPAADTKATTPPGPQQPQTNEEPRFVQLRQRMVDRHLRHRDIADERVLEVMGGIPRQRFVAPNFVEMAYDDFPLPIGHGQTISQPYIVALMTQLVQPRPESRALDIGTGSGYQAAVLAKLCKEVYTIEIVKPLADSAQKRLAEMGYTNVTVRCGDGYRGWPEHAPFDVIIVAAAADRVPEPLIDQLAPGGRLVMPVGGYFQELQLVEKLKDGTVERRNTAPVAFVPMTGEAQEKK